MAVSGELPGCYSTWLWLSRGALQGQRSHLGLLATAKSRLRHCSSRKHGPQICRTVKCGLLLSSVVALIKVHEGTR